MFRMIPPPHPTAGDACLGVCHMSRTVIRVFLCLALLLPALAVGAEPEPPPIDDAEEYRVIAAVLFPAEPEIPEAIRNDPPRRALYLAERPRLDGLGLGAASMTLQETTIQGLKMAPRADGSDAALAGDYNRKNEKAVRLVAETLRAHLQTGQVVRLITSQEMRALFRQGGGWEEYNRRSPRGDGIKSLSRVGFDPARTRAVVSVRHQADYEMGIGYRIYLEKSAATGRWLIVGSDLTYRS
jgi:hypothetical protein